MKLSSDKKPVLKITQLAWDKIWGLTFHHKTEVSCLGIMPSYDPTKLIDVVNVKQECSSSNTKMDKDWLNTLWHKSEEEGIDIGQWGVWVHTHADMGVFWSATDEATIQEFMHARKMTVPKEGIVVTDQWPNVLWSIVTNRKGEYKIRCDMIDPFRYSWDDCDHELVEEVDLCSKEFLAESSELVEIEIPTVVYPLYAGKGKRPTSIDWTRAYGGQSQVPAHTTTVPAIDRRFNAEVDIIIEEIEKKEKKIEVEHLSNPRLQDMFDSGVLTHTEAMQLEHEYLVTKDCPEGNSKKARKKANREAEATLNEKLDWYLSIHNDDTQACIDGDDSDWSAIISEVGIEDEAIVDVNMMRFLGEVGH